MRFALLLHLNPRAAERSTPEEAEAEWARYAAITQELADTGILRGGEALMPGRTATLVNVRDGRRVTAPAPAAELELGGFYLVDCEEEQALDIAARMPVATHGMVEVRPVMELPAAGS